MNALSRYSAAATVTAVSALAASRSTRSLALDAEGGRRGASSVRAPVQPPVVVDRGPRGPVGNRLNELA